MENIKIKINNFKMLWKKIINKISPANKYYKMTDGQLEKIASKWHIGGYGDSCGNIDRQAIIDNLIKKDQINFSFWSILIAFIAIIISIIAILK